jgi:hypothetical protein
MAPEVACMHPALLLLLLLHQHPAPHHRTKPSSSSADTARKAMFAPILGRTCCFENSTRLLVVNPWNKADTVSAGVGRLVRKGRACNWRQWACTHGQG